MLPMTPNNQYHNHSNRIESFSWIEESSSLNYNATSGELADTMYANTQNLPYHIGALFNETFPVRWIKDAISYYFPSEPKEELTHKVSVISSQPQEELASKVNAFSVQLQEKCMNKVNILISQSLDSSIEYHSKNNAIGYVTVQENNMSHEQLYSGILENSISLISNGTRNFDPNFIRSLPHTPIRVVYSHGYEDTQYGHQINFLQNPTNQQTLDVLSLLKNKQEVLFLHSCHGGAVHRVLDNQLGNSILVTFSKPRFSSLAARSNEIIEHTIRLANLQKNPKHIIVDIVNLFPFDIGIKVPGQKSRIFFNRPDSSHTEIKSSLLSIIDYLKLDDYSLDNHDIDESLSRKNLFELFEYAQNYEELSLEEQVSILKKIKDKDANFLNNSHLIDKNSLLHVALSNVHLVLNGKYYESTYYFALNILEHWIHVKANVNEQRTTDGYAPLHLAMILPNDLICAKKLMAAGANPNIKTKSGESALHLALTHRKLELVSQLIALGANINEPDGDGNTPLHLAMMQYKDPSCAKKIIAAGADINLINSKTKKSALHLALAYQEPELISELITLGANTYEPDNDGDTPLHLALKSNTNYEFAQYFIDKSVSDKRVTIDTVNKIGLTPVLIACFNNHVDVTNRLIGLGVNVHIKFHGRTLLDFAQDPKTIKLLRAAGVRKSKISL